MENATKALLITAAVLIVIVLVALGIYLVNSSKDSSYSASTMGQVITDSINNTLYVKIVDIKKFREAVNRSIRQDRQTEFTDEGLKIYGVSLRAPEESASGAFGGVKVMENTFKSNTQYQFKISFKQVYNNPTWDNSDVSYPGVIMKIKYKGDAKPDSYDLLNGPDGVWQNIEYVSKQGKTIEYLSMGYWTGDAITYIKDFDIYEIDSSNGELHGKIFLDNLK